MPFGKWEDFQACVNDISRRINPKTGKPYGEEIAAKICATIEKKSEQELRELQKE